MSENDKTLIYLHIPKTGGQTLKATIKRNYPKDKTWRFHKDGKTAELIRKADQYICLIGHRNFGIHRYLNKPYTYITMLRDPIDRVISIYYYLLRSPGHNLYDKVKDISFEDFVLDDKFRRQTENLQTLFISGKSSKELSIAKHNLKNYFSVVGIMERFDESLFLMSQEFGWKNINYKKKNVTKNRPAKEDFSEKIIDKLKEKNELDIELYEYGKELFEEKLKTLPESTKQKMNDYLQR
ncbi:sulfotransferase family 2 domain-containing protein [Metabacillus arenae]|uniref:Sulfotransferase family 2 domain-containing protein n=1 Tax=Metabacillus arenae TaxID=2771434 RepID=A0A926NEA7_9BACI|nr:sulfotransferase family 2 domain-containing protein [Metabacillus arenae]MBD1381914.1 sulfotransferase family 2 domain-containing protein [Metabacillus arenae]